jgi:type IV pilus assembly protein PilA
MKARTSQNGFTLIELLVVILIIAILVAIAIPVFIQQRYKAYEAQVRSALKDAATSIESYATENDGVLDPLNGASSAANNPPYQLVRAQGYNKSSTVEITVAVVAGTGNYCITATHSQLPAAPAHPWRVATYNSVGGHPGPADADLC